MRLTTLSAICLGTFLTLAACAPAPSAPEQDALEPLNRQIFAFNEAVDRFILKPIAKGYRAVTNKPIRKAISNVLANFYEPVTAANALLQGDVTHALSSSWRFALNTTFGIGGLNDFAGKYAALPRRDEDFGQTLAVWGVGHGSYVVLPILGPSSLRDAVGKVGDILIHPATWTADDETLMSVTAAQGIVQREKLLEVIDDIYETSLDPYATIRSGYLQRRRAEVMNTHNPDRVE